MPVHILIVDDEPWVVFFLHQVVKHVEPNYQVATAHTGAEALRLARREPPDLMITDYRLKDMNGLALITALKRMDRTPSIIMITAGLPPAAADDTDFEALRWIRKPFSTAQLITAIGKALEGSVA